MLILVGVGLHLSMKDLNGLSKNISALKGLNLMWALRDQLSPLINPLTAGVAYIRFFHLGPNYYHIQ